MDAQQLRLSVVDVVTSFASPFRAGNEPLRDVIFEPRVRQHGAASGFSQRDLLGLAAGVQGDPLYEAIRRLPQNGAISSIILKAGDPAMPVATARHAFVFVVAEGHPGAIWVLQPSQQIGGIVFEAEGVAVVRFLDGKAVIVIAVDCMRARANGLEHAPFVISNELVLTAVGVRDGRRTAGSAVSCAEG